jgi:hypothetical protein
MLSAALCCILLQLCRIVTVADFWLILWFYRARVRAFPFFLSMGSHSVATYHETGQRRQSVDSLHTGPHRVDVDRLGLNVHLSAQAGAKTKPNQTNGKPYL